MDFNHTDERRMLLDTLRRFFDDTYTFEKRLQIVAEPGGFSRDVWSQMAELGVIGALFSEDAGGFGGGGFDITVVFEEIGRAGVVEPLLATAVLGGGLVMLLGSDKQKELLEAIIAGDMLLAFAHGEPDARYDLNQVSTLAAKTDDGFVLNGQKSVVLNADSADYLVVSARSSGNEHDEDGVSLFLVEKATQGMVLRSYPTIDGGSACDITFEDVHVGGDALLGPLGGAYPAIEEVIARAALALSAEALGAMEKAKDLTLEYLKTRVQFGKPIGTFQALQHRMADVLIEIEQARSSVINAAGSVDGPRHAREMAVSAAKNMVGRAGKLTAEEAIQMHGGIGMTWEYALPHFAKRIVMIDHLLGDADHHLERYTDLMRDAV